MKKALGKILDSETQETSSPESLNFFSQTSPFTNIVDVNLHIKCEHAQLGLKLITVNDMLVYTKEDMDKALQLAQDESVNNEKPLLHLSILPD
eukprot:3204981-Ditylum_brightwellii.AAC.1